MTRLEYGDFYKFLVSLGMVLLGLSFVVPWLFLRESFGGMLTASDISGLTPTAQALLHYRQQAALWFVRSVWCISLALAIGGLVPLIMGTVLWVRKQRLLDQRDEIELRKLGLEVERLKREIEPLTPGEIAMKAIGEISEEVEAEGPAELAAVESVTTDIRDYLRVEEMFFEKLVACYGEARVLTHQRRRHAEYDAILISDGPVLRDVVFEVKRLARHLSMDRFQTLVGRVIALIQDYAVLEARLSTSVVGILVLVVRERDRDSATVDQYLWAA